MAKQQIEDSILISAAKAVGATLGRVKRLTSEATQRAPRKQSSETSTRRAQGSLAQAQSPAPSRRQRAASPKQEQPRTRRRAAARAIPSIEEPDMAAAQAGGSRSPRQTESSKRGKSRGKRSKSSRA